MKLRSFWSFEVSGVLQPCSFWSPAVLNFGFRRSLNPGVPSRGPLITSLVHMCKIYNNKSSLVVSGVRQS